MSSIAYYRGVVHFLIVFSCVLVCEGGILDLFLNYGLHNDEGGSIRQRQALIEFPALDEMTSTERAANRQRARKVATIIEKSVHMLANDVLQMWSITQKDKNNEDDEDFEDDGEIKVEDEVEEVEDGEEESEEERDKEEGGQERGDTPKEGEETDSASGTKAKSLEETDVNANDEVVGRSAGKSEDELTEEAETMLSEEGEGAIQLENKSLKGAGNKLAEGSEIVSLMEGGEPTNEQKEDESTTGVNEELTEELEDKPLKEEEIITNKKSRDYPSNGAEDKLTEESESMTNKDEEENKSGDKSDDPSLDLNPAHAEDKLAKNIEPMASKEEETMTTKELRDNEGKRIETITKSENITPMEEDGKIIMESQGESNEEAGERVFPEHKVTSSMEEDAKSSNSLREGITEEAGDKLTETVSLKEEERNKNKRIEENYNGIDGAEETEDLEKMTTKKNSEIMTKRLSESTGKSGESKGESSKEFVVKSTIEEDAKVTDGLREELSERMRDEYNEEIGAMLITKNEGETNKIFGDKSPERIETEPNEDVRTMPSLKKDSNIINELDTDLIGIHVDRTEEFRLMPTKEEKANPSKGLKAESSEGQGVEKIEGTGALKIMEKETIPIKNVDDQPNTREPIEGIGDKESVVESTASVGQITKSSSSETVSTKKEENEFYKESETKTTEWKEPEKNKWSKAEVSGTHSHDYPEVDNGSQAMKELIHNRAQHVLHHNGAFKKRKTRNHKKLRRSLKKHRHGRYIISKSLRNRRLGIN